MVKRPSNRGLTLIELLVATAIVGVLILLVMLALLQQLSRSRDARRKADLEKIKVAFEDYYNDNGCYPPPEVLQQCGGTNFSPYLPSIPCDPQSKQAYVYVPIDGSPCKGYRVLTALENTDDVVISQMGCDDACGCGFGSEYNYGISSGVSVAADSCNPLPGTTIADASPSPSAGGGSSNPSPSTQPGGSVIYVYACAPGSDAEGNQVGVCNQYEEGMQPQGCVTYQSSGACETACLNPENRCIY